jgi:uncharacterized repeat protein (TIGR01451 family)
MKRKRSDKQSWGALTSAMTLLGVLALFLFVPNSAIGATIVIDDMSVVQGSSASPILTDCDSAGGPLTAGVTGAAANLIGGARILEITHSIGEGDCTRAYVNGTATHGWAVANDPNSTGWGRAVWGGSATDINNYGLTLDLTNLTHFNFTYVKADHPTTFTFEVYNGATQGSQATITMDGLNDKINHHVAKADFTAISGLTAVDWSANISRITLRFNEVEDIDIYVREIQAITIEPGLACTKYFDVSTVEPGDEITATVDITNTGGVEMHVNVKDILDSGLTYKEPVAGFPAPNNVVGQELTWLNLGPLAPAGLLTLKYVITVDAISEGESLCNDVTATSVEYSATATNCRDCVQMLGEPGCPTFTQWGMIGFLLVLGAISVWLMRRRSSVS